MIPSPAKVELRKLLPIALPLVAAYLGEYAMFVTTKLVVGSLGFKELAAVGLAGSMTFEMMVVLMGVISITGVLAAQAEGAGDKATAGIAARQGIVVALILSVPLMALIWNIGDVFLFLGQDPEIAALSEPYARALAHRQPLYQAMAQKWGVTVQAEDMAQVRTETDLTELIAKALPQG